MPTTHFPNGVTNASNDSANGSMIFPDPTCCHVYMNDIDTYAAGDWVVTAVGAGSQALTAGNGGLLLLTNAAADNDGNYLQKTPAAFAFTANKRAWFATKFKVSDATQSDVQMGIVIVDTTPLDATDGIYFQKDDGSASIDVYVRKDATTGSNKKSAVATLVDATDIVLSWYYDGAGQLAVGVNGSIVAYMDASSTYLPDATNLTVSMTIQNGEAVAKTMTVDYIMAAFER
jgi:hypothetical protein